MKVEVLSYNDGLEARIVIRDFDADEWRGRFGTRQALLDLLRANGIAADRMEGAAIESVCSLLTGSPEDSGDLAVNLKEVQSLILASGTPPRDEEAEGLIFHKSYLSDALEVTALQKRLMEEGLEAVKKQIDPGCLVDTGQVVLSFLSIREGVAGADVFGNPVPFRAYTHSLPKCGRGITRLDRKWVAREAGVLVLQDDTLKVAGGMNASGEGLLRISEDKLKAWLVIQADTMQYDDDLDRMLDIARAAMARAGLRPLRDEARVRKALQAFVTDGTEQDLLVLEGSLPQNGSDGSIELLVDPEPDLPHPDSVDKVDFKAFSFFRAIRKGEKLARILPPKPGIAGSDVYGNLVLPRPGKPVSYQPGRNTELAPDDSGMVIASRDGRLVVEDGVPYVADTLKVGSDVSYQTGNLDFPGSVEVAGNVLDRFAISAKGDVGIGGVVENGVVISEGAILIKGGVIGGGSGLIKSKLSSVTIGFIRNQRIESDSSIVVYNEVLNGQLLARKSILMKSHSRSVIGGHLVAFEGIEVFNSGNEAGSKTILEVGKDFEVEASLLKSRQYLNAVRADFEFLEKKREKLELIVRWQAGRKPETRLLEQRVKGVLRILEMVRQTLLAKLNALEASLYNPGTCHITVAGTAYPGTVLKYKDKVIPITEPAQNKRWIFKGN